MKVIVIVDKGANQGTQYEIPLRSYRAIGRTGGPEVTVQLTEERDRVLEPDDLACVEAHLAKRSSVPPGVSDVTRLGAFKRGRDVLIEDEKVSRTHAMLFLDEEGASIVDLSSTNGTHVNGQRVQDADLQDGDIINIGKTRFILRVAS